MKTLETETVSSTFRSDVLFRVPWDHRPYCKVGRVENGGACNQIDALFLLTPSLWPSSTVAERATSKLSNFFFLSGRRRSVENERSAIRRFSVKTR